LLTLAGLLSSPEETDDPGERARQIALNQGNPGEDVPVLQCSSVVTGDHGAVQAELDRIAIVGEARGMLRQHVADGGAIVDADRAGGHDVADRDLNGVTLHEGNPGEDVTILQRPSVVTGNHGAVQAELDRIAVVGETRGMLSQHVADGSAIVDGDGAGGHDITDSDLHGIFFQESTVVVLCVCVCVQ